MTKKSVPENLGRFERKAVYRGTGLGRVSGYQGFLFNVGNH